MTFRQLRFLKCDACEVELEVRQVRGWFAITGLVTSEEEYEKLTDQATVTGSSGVLSGDFCSLACIVSWATNAETLRRLEGEM